MTHMIFCKIVPSIKNDDTDASSNTTTASDQTPTLPEDGLGLSWNVCDK